MDDVFPPQPVPASPRLLPSLPPIVADPERLERITVCTRPFRAAGPRIEAEHLGSKLLIHNYGHGGSGWSLSWGAAERVLVLLRAGGVAGGAVSVVGCGAMGLVTAIVLCEAGYGVHIYARDLPPAVRSSRATGLWSPDSRFALAAHLSAEAADAWEAMARHSWAVYGTMVRQEATRTPAAAQGAPITPAAAPGTESAAPAVEFHDRYLLSELPPAEAIAQREQQDTLGFAHLDNRLEDLYTHEDLGPGEHPFRPRWARRMHTPRFDITALSAQLLQRFRDAGGTLEQRTFHSPAELAELPGAAVIHCTGYGARALFGDESLTPVRGQIGWLPAQPELGYSLQHGRLSVVPRADGIAVQVGASSDDTGWQLADETPDAAEAIAAVRQLAALQVAPTPEKASDPGPR